MSGASPCLDVCIGVVNHDNVVTLRECLRTLPAACGRLAWEVLVIDNLPCEGSLEGVLDIVPAARIVQNERPRGFGENHNMVLAEAISTQRCRYVLVLNDDTELEEGSVEHLVDRMDGEPALGAAIPRIFGSDGSPLPGRLTYPTVHGSLGHDLTGRLREDASGWLQGCCILLRVEALRGVGIFDEQFFLFYEDVDLSLRLARGGWGLEVEPRARIRHHSHGSVLRDPYDLFIWRTAMRSRYLYFVKHRGLLVASYLSWSSRLISLARFASNAARFLLSGDRSHRRRARFRLELARYDPRTPSSVPAPT